jgi:hypothetical protein
VITFSAAMGVEFSSIIDDLSARKPDERQEAAEKWLEVSHKVTGSMPY